MSEQNISDIKENLNFIVNEDEEFLNIFNYKNIKCYKTPNYIYIGQVKDNDDMATFKNKDDNINNKDVIKKSQTKTLGAQKDKVDKNKNKKNYNSIKNGYGALISITKNIDGYEIITNKFIGNWVNDKRNGLGFNIDIYKNIYYGYYENNLKNGWGYYKWFRSGSTYEGNWIDNMMNGKGLYINKKYIYEGDFYNNLFINSKCEWIDILEIEMKNMNKNYIITNGSNNKLSNDIYLIILPFNFIKINLKKIATYIKYNYNKIPFLICTKKFIQQNKRFDITKFIFLSYYLDSSEKLNDVNMDSLIFDTNKNEKEKNISKNYDDSILSEDKDSNSSIKIQTNIEKIYTDDKSKSKYLNKFNDMSISSHSSDSKGENNSTSSTNSNDKCSDTNDSISNSDCSDNYNSEHSSSSQISLPSITSKESLSSIFSQHDSIKRCNTYESQLNNIPDYADTSYISSTNNKEATTSVIGSNEEGNNNIQECKDHSYIHIEENEEKNKKKKNEINNLINKYLNIYIDTDSSSSEYSLISSDMEKIKNENHLSKMNINNDKEELKKNNSFKNINKIPESNVLYDDINIIRKKISKDISKIRININLLNTLRNSNISCIYRIWKKIKNSLKMKYPFIINFNIKKNIYQNVNENNISLNTFTIPEWWNLDLYFGESENKICHDIFDPLYFQYNKGYKKIMNKSNIEQYDKEQEDNMSDIFNMKMFLSTDLLIDNTDDIPQLKNIIKDKFTKLSYINNLFFIIIDINDIY
ncbi:conserved Plasmodium protein, unknown function [Plasmodium sp. gorilla clade G2]|uniref:conserved Plasmodium protein, unknown function n=1 Tax=Plasmodium sp. gorilla clade G2 TaxID=880535 RepID=UPI000D2076B0|nr:conserved Plasmodium protein, unknown function [Plasmodium sp. gorilla clade G2]SOV18756.1 conserved Plasmodium protein, unknown function [Plasmodium sp. gorilla clade G2]